MKHTCSECIEAAPFTVNQQLHPELRFCETHNRTVRLGQPADEACFRPIDL